MVERPMKTNLSRIADETSVRKGRVKRLIRAEEKKGNLATMNYARLEKDMEVEAHSHPDSEEFYLFLEGKGEMGVDDRKFDVGTGDLVTILPNQTHALGNPHKPSLVFITIRVIKGV